MQIVLKIMETVFYIVLVYVILEAACEYRMCRHWLVRAFYAKTPYQVLFTKMQCAKDIEPQDLGKLTYVGYIGVVLSTAGLIFLVLYSIYQVCRGVSFSWSFRIQLWASCSFVWGVFSVVFQMIDSLIAWIIGLF